MVDFCQVFIITYLPVLWKRHIFILIGMKLINFITKYNNYNNTFLITLNPFILPVIHNLSMMIRDRCDSGAPN